MRKTREEALRFIKKAIQHRNEAKQRMEEEYARKGQKVNVVFL